jgi:hypothetical protein
MVLRNVWFWKGLYPLVRRFCRERGVAFNRVVNLAVESWLGVCDVEELKVWVEIEKLAREDSQLRRVSSTMLRSGSYLPKYADRLFRAPWDSECDKTSPFHYPRKGEVPLKALNPKEEKIMRRVLARREAIAQRIAELLDQVLPAEKFRLAPRRSKSRRRDKNKRKGGEKFGSDT